MKMSIKCVKCGTMETPLWRKGETGQKVVCNACAMRMKRAVARSKGCVEKRKRKMSECDLYIEIPLDRPKKKNYSVREDRN